MFFIQWGWKGPKAAAEWGAYGSLGSRPRDATHIVMASTEALSFNGERPSLSPSRPFLKDLPRRLQSRTNTWDFCRLCNTRFTKSLLFSVSLAIHHGNSQKNIYESGGWLFTISFFSSPWLSHIPLHPLGKEGTEWDTSAENETLSPQKNYAFSGKLGLF